MTDIIEMKEVSLEVVAGGRGRSMPSTTLNFQKTNNSSIYVSGFSASAIGFDNLAGVAIGVDQYNG